MMYKRGVGHVAASGSSIEKRGKQKIACYADDGEFLSMRTQWAHVEKALHSVHKMIL